MKLYPRQGHVKNIIQVYEKYKDKMFPALREQLGIHFDKRYRAFWRGRVRRCQYRHLSDHTSLGLKYDLDVIRAANANLTMKDIIRAYEAIVQDYDNYEGIKKGLRY